VIGQFEFRHFSAKTCWQADTRSGEVVIETLIPGGGRLRDEEMHLWTSTTRGKVIRFRHYADTANT